MDLSPQMVRDIPKVFKYHWEEKNFNWPMTIVLSLAHCAAVVGVSKFTQCSAETLLWAFCLWPISGFGMTAGAHRLWSHRSYEAHFIVRFILVMCNSIASQTSIFHFSRDHRLHHKFVETKADPYDATRGFFFAHVGWLLLKKDPAVREAGRTMDFSDLLADPLVYWQNKLDPWFTLYMCFVWPAQIASYFWGEQFWNAFFCGRSPPVRDRPPRHVFGKLRWPSLRRSPLRCPLVRWRELIHQYYFPRRRMAQLAPQIPV